MLIEKTETHGDPYDTVLYGDQAINYLRPFVFTLAPTSRHPRAASPESIVRTLCLYDNSGESFRPGEDRATSPVTRHVALSQALMFLLIPRRTRGSARRAGGSTAMPGRRPPVPHNPGNGKRSFCTRRPRVRRYAGLSQNARHSRPLLVVVTKYDCWSELLGGCRLDPPWISLVPATPASV